MQSILNMDHFNVDQRATSISSLDMIVENKVPVLKANTVPCPSKHCDNVTIKDVVKLINDIQYSVTFEDEKVAADCSGLSGQLIFIPIGIFNPIIISNMSVVSSPSSASCYFSWDYDEMLEGPLKDY